MGDQAQNNGAQSRPFYSLWPHLLLEGSVREDDVLRSAREMRSFGLYEDLMGEEEAWNLNEMIVQ
jgi:hypothetical protein